MALGTLIGVGAGELKARYFSPDVSTPEIKTQDALVDQFQHKTLRQQNELIGTVEAQIAENRKVDISLVDEAHRIDTLDEIRTLRDQATMAFEKGNKQEAIGLLDKAHDLSRGVDEGYLLSAKRVEPIPYDISEDDLYNTRNTQLDEFENNLTSQGNTDPEVFKQKIQDKVNSPENLPNGEYYDPELEKQLQKAHEERLLKYTNDGTLNVEADIADIEARYADVRDSLSKDVVDEIDNEIKTANLEIAETANYESVVETVAKCTLFGGRL